MKRVFIISLVVLGLGFVSCQKQEIVPNSSDSVEVPVWEDNARGGGSTLEDTGGEGGVGGITDPNDENDEDGPGTSNDDGSNGKTKKRKGQN